MPEATLTLIGDGPCKAVLAELARGLGISILLLSISGFGLLSCIWSVNLGVSFERALLNIATTFFLITYAVAFSSANQLRILITLSVGVTITLTFGIVFGVAFNSSQIFFLGNFRGGFSNSNSLALMIIVFTVPLCLANLGQGGFGSILPVAVVFSSMTHGLFETWIFTFGNISALFFWMCLSFILRLDLEMGRTGKRQGTSLT